MKPEKKKEKGGFRRIPFKVWVPVFLAAALFLAVCAVLLLPPGDLSADREFTQLCHQLFDEELRSNTLNMHYLLARPADFGITDYEVTLGAVLEEAETGDSQEMFSLENYRERLSHIPESRLDPENRLTYEILCDYIDLQLTTGDLSLYPELLSPSSGIQSQLPVLLAEYPFRTAKDAEDYLSLLSLIPSYFDEICVYERKRAEEGLSMADVSLDKVVNQCESFLADTGSHFLKTTFDSRIGECSFLSGEEKSSLISRNSALLEEKVFPAYRKLADFAASLKGTGTEPRGVGNLPKGKAYYEYLVEYLTGTDYSVEELKKLLEARWLTDYTKLQNMLNHSGALYTVSDSFPASPDPDAMLEDLKRKIAADFPPLTDTSCIVKYVDPALEPYLSPAFYLTPPIDDSTQNVIYINKSAGYSGLELYTTLAHEGYPGHLYQSVFLNEQKLPLVRHLPYYGGYIEGWGLYTEMYSYGLADMNPDLAEMERLNHSLYLCLYAMLDIHIHYDNFTLADTVRFLSAFGRFPEETVAELYTYIVEEPANYLKYYVGYLEILRLQNEAKKDLGEKFSLKEYHRFFLSLGPAPFDIIKKWQDIWVSDILSSKTSDS